jgi:hypothetical protein
VASAQTTILLRRQTSNLFLAASFEFYFTSIAHTPALGVDMLMLDFNIH